ncbi:MAG: hypothetical protein C0408_00580 [Odoribacter sp.]|nr:hypothetical protein [Odoribacter sp.]
MKKLLIIAVISIFGINSVYGQGELNEQQKIFFRNERTFAILLNTDGFGLSYREGKRINYLNKKLLEIEISTLRHPKEVKLPNPAYQTPGTFVFGKINSVILLRGGIGFQHEIFKKADMGGIAIRYFYTGGPVIAFEKPVYYKILDRIAQYEFIIIEEKLDIKKHEPSMIYSKSSFTKGLNEMKLLPGIFAKGGFNFEYSKQDKVIHAIELGAQINLFPKKIPIMATASNKAIFFSLFASYRFGVVTDPLDPESNKFSNIFSRKQQ